MNPVNIELSGAERGEFGLSAYEMDGGICISTSDFDEECVLSRESTEKLRDFLNGVLESS